MSRQQKSRRGLLVVLVSTVNISVIDHTLNPRPITKARAALRYHLQFGDLHSRQLSELAIQIRKQISVIQCRCQDRIPVVTGIFRQDVALVVGGEEAGEAEAEVEVDQGVVGGGIQESRERVRGFRLTGTLIPMLEDFETFAFTNVR